MFYGLQGRNQKCFSGRMLSADLSIPFLIYFYSLFLPPQSGLSNSGKRFWGALLAAPVGRTTFVATRQVTGCKCIFGVFKATGMCLMAANVIQFLLNEM